MGSSNNIEEKVKYVENLIRKNNQARLEIVEKLEERKFNRWEIRTQLDYLRWNYGRCRNDFDDPGRYQHEGVDHKEIVIKIRGLVHRLQSGRNSLAQERRILKEIKSAQEQKEKLYVVEETNWVPWHLGEIVNSKKSTKDYMQLRFNEKPGLWKEQKAYVTKAERLKKESKVIEEEMKSLWKKLERTNVEKGKLYTYILELKR